MILVFFVIGVLFLWHQPAHAYLDPGTGSMIVATILGGIGGLVVIGKIYWGRILVALGLRKKGEKKETPEI